MERSSIYLKCPGCSEQTLIRHLGATYRCAGCGFDYGELAQDPPRFEAFLIARMREGPMGQLGAIALHQWVSGLGVQASVAEIRAMAERGGVQLPEPADAQVAVRRILLAVGLVILAVVLAIVWAVFG
jgi:hypothetical protein